MNYKQLCIDNLPIRAHCKKVLKYHDKVSTGKIKHIRLCSDKLDYSKNLVAFNNRKLGQKEQVITYVILNNSISKLNSFTRLLKSKGYLYQVYDNKIVVKENDKVVMYDLVKGTKQQAMRQVGA